MSYVEVEASAVLPLEPAALFAFVGDPRNDPYWVHGCRGMELLSGLPLGRGSRLREKISFGGVPLRIYWEIVAYEPPDRIVYSSMSGPLPMTITHRLTDANGETTFSHRIAARLPRLACPLSGVAIALLRREACLNLAGLRFAIACSGFAGDSDS